MKEVMIILRPKMYFPTKDALDQAGFHSMTIREIIGRGKCPVHYDYDEGAPVKHRLVAKRMIDMFVRDEDLQKLIDTVVEVIRRIMPETEKFLYFRLMMRSA